MGLKNIIDFLLHGNSNYSELYEQSLRKDQEHELARSSPDLSPDTIGKEKRYYHYKDVSIRVVWQFSGQYEKSCESAGIKRGDMIELVFDHFENDPDSVAVVWNGEIIGHMLENRMRGMVKQWKAKKKPVSCYVSHVGGETKILLEFAFYGFVKYKNLEKAAGNY